MVRLIMQPFLLVKNPEFLTSKLNILLMETNWVMLLQSATEKLRHPHESRPLSVPPYCSIHLARISQKLCNVMLTYPCIRFGLLVWKEGSVSTRRLPSAVFVQVTEERFRHTYSHDYAIEQPPP